jgi:hypothetical protein
MNQLFDLVVLDDTYLQQVFGLIRADQHREANLIVSRHTPIALSNACPSHRQRSRAKRTQQNLNMTALVVGRCRGNHRMNRPAPSTSGNRQIAPQRLTDDLAGRRLVGGSTGIDRRSQLRIDPNRDDLRRR